MAENYTGLADEDGDIGDWIELYNPGNLPVNLFGYSLSDKQNIPGLWIFPDVKIMPGEYLLVWADGKDRVTDAGIHTNFRISAGEVITCRTRQGRLLIRCAWTGPFPIHLTAGFRWNRPFLPCRGHSREQQFRCHPGSYPVFRVCFPSRVLQGKRFLQRRI